MGWCPKCEYELGQKQKLTERKALEEQWLWRADNDSVVISVRSQITVVVYEICPVCNFQELIDFKRANSLVRLLARTCLN